MLQYQIKGALPMLGTNFLLLIEEAQNHGERPNLYVDKSQFIEKVVNGDYHATLIVRPRRFGKTVNFQMLKYFLAAHYVIEQNRIKPKFGESDKTIYFKGSKDYTIQHYAQKNVDKKDREKTAQKENIKFKELEIAKNKKFFDQHHGRYPVLYISFKQVKAQNLIQFKQNLKRQISKIYREHKYLLVYKLIMLGFQDDEALNKDVDNIFKEYQEKKLDLQQTIEKLYTKFTENERLQNRIQKDIYLNSFQQIVQDKFGEDDVLLSSSLLELAQMMKCFFKQLVYIIIDQYDAGIVNMIGKLLSQSSQKKSQKSDTFLTCKDQVIKAAKIISKVLGACGKDSDDYVRKFIMTGVTEVVISQGSSFNNLKVYSMDSSLSRYYGMFGFTEQQVKDLVKEAIRFRNKSNLSTKDIRQIFKNEAESYNQSNKPTQTKDKEYFDKVVEQIKDYYNGYEEGKGGRKIYTPWSVVQHLLKLSQRQQGYNLPQPQEYWEDSGSYDLLRNLPNMNKNILNKLVALATDSVLYIDNGLYISQAKSTHLTNIISTCYFPETTEKVLYYLLIRFGYIVKDNTQQIKQGQKIKYRFANLEVANNFKKQILQFWLENDIGPKYADIVKNIAISLYDPCKFQNALQTNLIDNLGNGNKTESDFNGIVRGILEMARIQGILNAYIFSEYTVDHKRIDTLIVPNLNAKENEKCMIIHEYKQSKADQAQSLSDEALWQVYVNGYLNVSIKKKFESEDYRYVIIRAVVFTKKQTNSAWMAFVKQHKYLKENVQKAQNKFSVFNLKKILKNQPKYKNFEDREVIKYCLDNAKTAKKSFLQMQKSSCLNSIVSPFLFTYEDSVGQDDRVHNQKNRSDILESNEGEETKDANFYQIEKPIQRAHRTAEKYRRDKNQKMFQNTRYQKKKENDDIKLQCADISDSDHYFPSSLQDQEFNLDISNEEGDTEHYFESPNQK